MSGNKKIKTALVSVFHKDGLDDILKKLHSEGVKFISTGGTQSFIESLGFPCEAVESLTGYPSILGGRVKTLHPKVFGGILCRREMEGDLQQIAQYEIPEIDLVIVDLYPFEQTVASGADEQAIIEKIDIAINRAKKLEKYQIDNNKRIGTVEANPNTEVYKIVEYLIKNSFNE